MRNATSGRYRSRAGGKNSARGWPGCAIASRFFVDQNCSSGRTSSHRFARRTIPASDSFAASHKQLELEGKLSSQLNDEYFEALRKGVMYWDGEKFVDRLAMNKHYFDIMMSNPSP